MMKLLGTAFLLLIIVLASRPAAFADPAADFQKIIATFGKLKTFHHEYDDSKGMVISQDYVAPDRYRSLISKSAGQPPFNGQLLIGAQIWTYSKGKWSKMPPFLSALAENFIKNIRSKLLDGSMIDMTSVKSLGKKWEKGQFLWGYSFTMKNNLGSETLWVDYHEYPVEGTIESSNGGGTFTYSNINGPIEIAEP